MSKMFQVYGIGQALIPVLPPPLPFQNPPTSNQTNYEIGQVVYTPPVNPTIFYIYAGGGSWEVLAASGGNIAQVLGTANQVTVTTVAGVATISLPAAITTPGSLTTTTTLASGTTLAAGTSMSAGTSITAGTTLTATLGAITATNGNFVGTAVGTGVLLNSAQASGAAASPVVVNGRSGRATFTSVSIAAAADLTLTLTNSAITASTTEVMLSMSGATTGSALSIKSKTASAGSLAIVVTNGTGATTTTADIQIDFLVLNA
jgi:hypothetical protein